VFWDPTYQVTGDYWIKDTENNGALVAPRFIPRLREIVNANYPGTKIALTEYNWGALHNINGALAQADLLGIFGREGLDMATLWGPPKPTDPGAFAFKIYRNYDDAGGAFGETSVQVLFDGIPAPLIYVSATQCSAVVPYFGVVQSTTHVQVEYQGVRSDALVVPLAATAPGVFTADFSGRGQGAVTNEDQSPNSPGSPAKPGSVVTIWATGEGVTDPPGIDGRPAVDALPKPVAPITVQIGGLPASIEYAGTAPGGIPGVPQINARMSKDVVAGDTTPVRVKIGSASSQDGVTIVVR
jgi:uncharacterized protein (TIGR03437 family)